MANQLEARLRGLENQVAGLGSAVEELAKQVLALQPAAEKELQAEAPKVEAPAAAPDEQPAAEPAGVGAER